MRKGDSLVALLKERVDRLVDGGVLVSGLSIRSRGLLSLITRDRHLVIGRSQRVWKLVVVCYKYKLAAIGT